MAGNTVPDDARRIVVRPPDNGEALINPSMGWVLHYYDNILEWYGSKLAPHDTVDDYPGLSVVYLRLAWSCIEPEEGAFNWSVVDTPAQRWIAKGKQVAFRFSCTDVIPYSTPEWVEKAGARGYHFPPEGQPCGIDPKGSHWEPVYDDPVFLAKLESFLAAAAARYDGSPEVAFIDIGSFGIWGEGHTSSSTGIHYPASVIEKHIDLHAKYFRSTLLVANDDFGAEPEGRGDWAAIHHAFERGLTLRDDSILVDAPPEAYFHQKMARPFWPLRPVILESAHYGHAKQHEIWDGGELYLQAVEDYHASYASIHWWPREFLDENCELIARMNRRLGYRIQLAEASWPEQVRPSGDLALRATWRNAGVAPCYPGGHPALTLKDDQEGIVAVLADQQFDLRSLPVGPPGEAETREELVTFSLPFTVKTGNYGVYVSVGTATGTPKIALPLPGDDGQRRYRIGSVRVAP
ncbi:MAG: DUF4832 domain-containing protein [Armatimonadota bacterium]